MSSIISALVEEHRKFCAEFEHIEQVLPRTRELAKVKYLAHLVENMLLRHAAAEEDLLLFAVDHVVRGQKPRLDRFHREHQEIDAQLTQVHLSVTPAQACRLLRAAMAASRRHFKHEERTVFPLVERLMRPEVLRRLGRMWLGSGRRTEIRSQRKRTTVGGKKRKSRAK